MELAVRWHVVGMWVTPRRLNTAGGVIHISTTTSYFTNAFVGRCAC